MKEAAGGLLFLVDPAFRVFAIRTLEGSVFKSTVVRRNARQVHWRSAIRATRLLDIRRR